MQTFFLAPTGFNAGLTSVTLGAIRSLEQAGLRVASSSPSPRTPRTAKPSAPPTSPRPSAA